ncbi:MAG: alpha-amylase family glycosyl hydrolase, partial [Cyanobacteria bacterium P01_E01_bin.35]
MALQEPLSNSYVGGEIKFVFNDLITDLNVTVNGVEVAIALREEAINTYWVSFNDFPSDVPLTVDLNYQESGRAKAESITVIKPRHDLGGMGATVIRQGTQISGTFLKFWLPKVKEVKIIGSFNDWERETRTFDLTELADSGYWYGFSPYARPGDDYKFYVRGFDNAESEVSDPAAKDTIQTVHNSADDNDANAVIVDPDSFNWLYDSYYGDRRGDLRQHIIYQVHWGTFLRKSTGSTQPSYEPFSPGVDIAQKRFNVAQKLQHVANLGFTTIQLLPVQESNGATNAGYDPSFFFAIESSYGTPDDLRILVDEAHKLGLAVIFDAVINHLTNQPNHASFSQEFIRGWYIKENAPWSNHLQFGGSDWGPDPDFDRPEIRSLLIDCIRMYFNEYHVDGIRFDATTTIPRSALKEIIGQLQQEYGWQGKYLIAEHLTGDPLD